MLLWFLKLYTISKKEAKASGSYKPGTICLGSNKRRFVISWLDRQGFYGKYRNPLIRSDDARMFLFMPTLGAAVFIIQKYYLQDSKKNFYCRSNNPVTDCIGSNKRRFVITCFNRQGFYGKYRNQLDRHGFYGKYRNPLIRSDDARMILFKSNRRCCVQ